MATNFEMAHVPEAISHAVYYYMLTRNNLFELHWTLTNALEMLEGCSFYDHEQAVAFENMKNAAIPSVDGALEGQAEVFSTAG